MLNNFPVESITRDSSFLSAVVFYILIYVLTAYLDETICKKGKLVHRPASF